MFGMCVTECIVQVATHNVIPNHDSCIHFADFIERIDEILSTVDDTTFGEFILEGKIF